MLFSFTGFGRDGIVHPMHHWSRIPHKITKEQIKSTSYYTPKYPLKQVWHQNHANSISFHYLYNVCISLLDINSQWYSQIWVVPWRKAAVIQIPHSKSRTPNPEPTINQNSVSRMWMFNAIWIEIQYSRLILVFVRWVLNPRHSATRYTFAIWILD